MTPASLTVRADNKSKIYGAADPTLTYTVTGTLYYGDGPSVVSGVTLSTATGAAATVGTHVITVTGGTAANYTITDVNGTLTVTPLMPPPQPLVTLINVQLILNKKHLVTQILVTFSGAVQCDRGPDAGNLSPGNRRQEGLVRCQEREARQFRSADFNAASDMVTLTPKKAFALTKPVQLRVNGQLPSGLEDSIGRLHRRRS